MDFSKAVATHINLPDDDEGRNRILDFAAGQLMTRRQIDEFMVVCRDFPADIFTIGDRFFSIFCPTPDQWVLVPFTQQANDQYRRQHLIGASHLQHYSLAIH